MAREPHKFIIIGLPRSRTSWLANLFTYGSCFCLHDGLAQGNDFFLRLRTIAALHPEIRHVGNSDSGIPLFMPAEDFADCKVLVVLRPVKDALEGFARYFYENPYPDAPRESVMDHQQLRKYFDFTAQQLKRFYSAVPSLRKLLLTYDDLNDIEQVGRAWKFIAPDEPFNCDRFRALDRLRINPASKKVRWENQAKPLAVE